MEEVCKGDGERHPHWNAELLLVGQFCIFVTFCNGWNCYENDYSCFIKRQPYYYFLYKNTNEDEIFILRISMKQNTISPALPWGLLWVE